jgi:hypothetical protein
MCTCNSVRRGTRRIRFRAASRLSAQIGPDLRSKVLCPFTANTIVGGAGEPSDTRIVAVALVRFGEVATIALE